MDNEKLKGEFVLSQQKTEPDKHQKNAQEKDPSPELLVHNHEHKKPKFYSSMSVYPDGVTFQNQEADEDVVLLVRRDFITNVPWILSSILLLFVPPVIFFLSQIFFSGIVISPILLLLSTLFYYLIVFGFTLLNFSIWYFNVGIVTNKRAMDLDVPNILVKMISEARLPSIVDVSFTQAGGIRSIFDYGDIFIQTEGIHQNIEYDRAPNPNMVRKIIGELVVDEPV
ncbi:MAG: hypothetical protein KBC00_00810 [Candidatus Levybacteria bacterium]|nr:hypothetical protein [Candidatus Levybacteria bacterium]MBP9814734.1 hypothetical protein [Candidatus Levybacteria bacterium]